MSFSPIWEGSIEGWATKFINKQRWRVGREHEFADLLQEAYLYFLICKDRYKVETGSHFMRLFQTCMANYFHRLSIVRTRRKELEIDIDYDEGPIELVELLASDESLEEDSDCRMMIEDAPEPIGNLLSGLGIPEGKRQRPRRLADGGRETTNEFFCRLSGVDPLITDMVGRVLCWIHGGVIPIA